MNPRLLIVAGVVAALAFAGLLAGYLTRDDDSGRSRRDGVSPRPGFRGARIPDGVPAPDFELRDQDGEPLRMRDLRGKPVVVTFLYTHLRGHLPGDRPADPRRARRAGPRRAGRRDLGRPGERHRAERPPLPGRAEHDRPDALRARPPRRSWRRSGRPTARRRRPCSRSTWRALVLVDAQGRQRVGFPMQETSPDMIAHDLRVLEAE